MANTNTSIAWTETTWNPVRGCTKVSAGCAHCFAERMAARFAGPGRPYEGLARGGHWTGEVRCLPDELDKPLHWRKPRRVFVNSMSDLFHERVPDEFIDRVFRVMQTTAHHTYQVLTKRPERMRQFLAERVSVPWGGFTFGKDCGRHIWLGTTVEDQAAADERIPHLCETPAAVRWLSCEPLIEDLGTLDLRGIHWVVVGAESGPGARPCRVEWVRSIVRQCQAAGVAVFVKQLHLDAGRLSRDPAEWPEDLRGRQYPEAAGG